MSSVLLFVAAAGLLQAVLLALIIYFHPLSDRNVNKFLACYVISVAIPMAMTTFQSLFGWQSEIYLEPFNSLTGPFLYLYILSFKEVITLRKAAPHFILFAACLGLTHYFYVVELPDYSYSKEIPKEVVHHWISHVVVGARIIQMTGYYFACRSALLSYQRSIRHLFSNTARISLSWGRWLVDGFIFILVLHICIFLFAQVYPDKFTLMFLAGISLVAPYIYLVTFKGVTQPTVWQLEAGSGKEEIAEEMHEAEILDSLFEGQREARQGVDIEKRDAIIAKAVALMEEHKLFKQSELTLKELAERIEMPAYQVSQAINEGMKKTFYDLVNGYRVEEAKRLLMDPRLKNHKIVTIGMDAGFNSKTTFNTVFKKFTGSSPTEYRERQR